MKEVWAFVYTYNARVGDIIYWTFGTRKEIKENVDAGYSGLGGAEIKFFSSYAKLRNCIMDFFKEDLPKTCDRCRWFFEEGQEDYDGFCIKGDSNMKLCKNCDYKCKTWELKPKVEYCHKCHRKLDPTGIGCIRNKEWYCENCAGSARIKK